MRVVDRVRPDIKVAVLSNNGPDVRPIWNSVHALDQRVDLVVVSGEERISKPNRRIYELTARRLGANVSRCVFVDDSPRNIDGAAIAGMRTVLHQTSDITARALLELVDAGPGFASGVSRGG